MRIMCAALWFAQVPWLLYTGVPAGAAWFYASAVLSGICMAVGFILVTEA